MRPLARNVLEFGVPLHVGVNDVQMCNVCLRLGSTASVFQRLEPIIQIRSPRCSDAAHARRA